MLNSKEEALRHLQQGQLFLLTILDRKFYVFAPKGATPEALRAEMTQHDLGDVPNRCYGEIPNAAVTEIQSLDQISEQKHFGWLPYLFGPFGDYVNWIDPTVKECVELASEQEDTERSLIKKRAFELKPGDLLVLASGQTAELTKVDKSGLDFGKHDLLLYLDGVEKPVLIDLWAQVEVE